MYGASKYKNLCHQALAVKSSVYSRLVAFTVILNRILVSANVSLL